VSFPQNKEKEVEELKPFDENAIPDVGQRYWAHEAKMEQCKGWSFRRTFLVVVPCAIVSAYALMWSVWAGDQPLVNSDSHDLWLSAVAVVGSVVFFVTGVAAFALTWAYVRNARARRRLQREMPPRPREYDDKTAYDAHSLGSKADWFNERLADAQAKVEALRREEPELYEELARLNDYKASMDEKDIDTFTLHN